MKSEKKRVCPLCEQIISKEKKHEMLKAFFKAQRERRKDAEKIARALRDAAHTVICKWGIVEDELFEKMLKEE